MAESLGMAWIWGVLFDPKAKFQEGYLLFIILMSLCLITLAVALYRHCKHNQRLKKFRNILRDNEEYERLAVATRMNLWEMEKLVVYMLSKLSKSDRKKIERTFRLNGPNCRQGLRKIMGIYD